MLHLYTYLFDKGCPASDFTSVNNDILDLGITRSNKLTWNLHNAILLRLITFILCTVLQILFYGYCTCNKVGKYGLTFSTYMYS